MPPQATPSASVMDEHFWQTRAAGSRQPVHLRRLQMATTTGVDRRRGGQQPGGWPVFTGKLMLTRRYSPVASGASSRTDVVRAMRL